MTESMPLSGQRILIVEDEFLIAMELSQTVSNLGGEVLGPVSTVAAAEALLNDVDADGAVLDVRLGSETSAPLAEALLSRGVPVLLTTGYAGETLPSCLAQAPRLAKPYTRACLEQVVKTHFANV